MLYWFGSANQQIELTKTSVEVESIQIDRDEQGREADSFQGIQAAKGQWRKMVPSDMVFLLIVHRQPPVEG
jgi:hypothetical protein